jgi:hypothetical protein
MTPQSALADERHLQLEERRLALEEKRAEYEQENQRADREANQRKEEAETRLREIEVRGQTRGITAPRATAIGALMTLLGGVIGAGLTGYFNRSVEQQHSLGLVELERQKFETGLIVDALRSHNPVRAVPILQFYAVAGLIPSYKDSVISLTNFEGGAKFPVNPEFEQTETAAFLSKNVISVCSRALEAFKDDPSGFVRAVAGEFGLDLAGTADQIIDQIQRDDWEVLPNGIAAAARARAGYLVIGGLKGGDQASRSEHGFVVVVVDGPLGAGRYPTAFWGRVGSGSGSGKTINWVWNTADRDRVIYAARPLAITTSR